MTSLVGTIQVVCMLGVQYSNWYLDYYSTTSLGPGRTGLHWSTWYHVPGSSVLSTSTAEGVLYTHN